MLDVEPEAVLLKINEQSTSSADRFWNRKTASLIPYVPGEQPRGQKLIKLNTNENPYQPAPEVIRVLKKFDYDRLRLYPDPLTVDFTSRSCGLLWYTERADILRQWFRRSSRLRFSDFF